MFGRGAWLEEADLQHLHAAGDAIAHCPTSNFFLGGGALNLARALKVERPVRVGLGTDIGVGTSFSILATLAAAYQATQSTRSTLPVPDASADIGRGRPDHRQASSG